MARQCGVCKQAPREGEEMRPIRLRTDAELEAFGIAEVGLYSACSECGDKKRQILLADPDSGYETLETIPNKALM